nr:ZIP family metal transporter [Aquimarina agarivorans]
MNYLLPIIAVIIGFVVVYFLKLDNQRNIKILLAFSGGFLLAITIFNLLPEIFEHSIHSTNSKYIGLFVLFGILFQIFLEYFSKGAEHGHVHSHDRQKKFPWLLFFSLSIHAFLEGFPIHKTHGLLAGIIIHKIPVAIILATFLLRSAISKPNTFIFMLLFAIATPLGSFVSENFAIITHYYTEIVALVIGIFLHISTTILFESSEGHRFNLAKFTAIISAIAIAYFI